MPRTGAFKGRQNKRHPGLGGGGEWKEPLESQEGKEEYGGKSEGKQDRRYRKQKVRTEQMRVAMRESQEPNFQGVLGAQPGSRGREGVRSKLGDKKGGA